MKHRFRKPLAAALLGAAFAGPAAATCGPEPILGEVCMFAFDYCPRGYASLDGGTMAVNQNQALFSLLGLNFGGSGVTTFNRPDLRGRTPIGAGSGPNLTASPLGTAMGAEQVTLTPAQMPAHTHVVTLKARPVTDAPADTGTPGGTGGGTGGAETPYTAADFAANVVATVASTGGGQPVPVRNPYAAVRFCVAVSGIYPSRP